MLNRRQDGVAVFLSPKIGCSLARTHVTSFFLDRQQRGKGWCRHPTGWILGGECIWCGLHLRPNHPLETSNQQRQLYHYICLCPPVWLHWFRKGQLLWQAPSSICKNSYLRDSHFLGAWNGYVGKSTAGYQGVLGGHGWGTRNTEGEKLLEFPMSCNLIIGNTCFKKQPNRLITFTSAEGRTICSFGKPSASMWEMSRLSLASRSPSNTICWSVISVLIFPPTHPPTKKKCVPCLRTWRLRVPEAQSEY